METFCATFELTTSRCKNMMEEWVDVFDFGTHQECNRYSSRDMKILEQWSSIYIHLRLKTWLICISPSSSCSFEHLKQAVKNTNMCLCNSSKLAATIIQQNCWNEVKSLDSFKNPYNLSFVEGKFLGFCGKSCFYKCQTDWRILNLRSWVASIDCYGRQTHPSFRHPD